MYILLTLKRLMEKCSMPADTARSGFSPLSSAAIDKPTAPHSNSKVETENLITCLNNRFYKENSAKKLYQ